MQFFHGSTALTRYLELLSGYTKNTITFWDCNRTPSSYYKKQLNTTRIVRLFLRQD
ncbi:unnamed protein product [Acanthoscelides obtectus]|uniref:Uncharacterized protein n=1 Tax=Acanthoscelides obtectus TaxID=200917 RepID=A0A9P0JR83_ACAOB|nr:unnamed protein product [Acanthoscelides obtectus]CAK1667968.1 hypothetical protein AOBTE_LOCUS26146 [Acanthoscelides obtectus]